MNTILGAAGGIGLAVLSAPVFWYCLTALACASILSSGIREGLRLAARYVVTTVVLSGLRSPAELRRVRQRMGARGAFGGLAEGRHFVRHGLTEREIGRLDRDVADGYFPDEPRRRKGGNDDSGD